LQTALVDAGVMIALFDLADQFYERYTGIFRELLSRRVQLVTSWPCVTEASYSLAPKNHLALLEWLQSGAVSVENFSAVDLQPMVGWVEQYSETGKTLMDFADASLYWLAIELKTNLVLTVDRRDFSRYRLPYGQAFEIL
jgi:predicted nucleic acid-binding protein